MRWVCGVVLAACGSDPAAVDAGSGDDAGPRAMEDAAIDPGRDGGPMRDADVMISPGLVFFDDFEYPVARDTAGAGDAFRAHGWAGAKTQQDGGRGANGYVYTTDTVPGYDGALPGVGSSRVLVLEALPATLDGQTDFYVQLGDGEGPIGQIPANHWFQLWIFSPSGADQNLFTNGKFFYPNRATFYPATIDNEGYVYLASLAKFSGETLAIDCNPDRAVPCPDAFFGTHWNSVGGFTSRHPDSGGTLDQNLGSVPPVVPGVWTLVRMHVDASGTDPRATPGQAVYELWIRRLGDAEFTKTTEWIGGVTTNPRHPEAGPVDLTPTFTDGFRTVRIPTTVGGTTREVGDWNDYRLYIDDFAVAGAEEDLPVYP